MSSGEPVLRPWSEESTAGAESTRTAEVKLPLLAGKRGDLLLKVIMSQASDWMVSNVSRYQNLS